MRSVLCVAIFVALCASPSTATAFEIGFFDPEAARVSVDVPATLPLARSSGASMVRVQVAWATIAPARPVEPENPSDTAYDWAAVDAAVAEARSLGLRVLLSVTAAPPWAEGGDRPPDANFGSWKPQPTSLGAFMTAVARRYRDVAGFQVWNEPNLSRHLSPQWTMRDGRFRPDAAVRYRAMLRAAYVAVKAVDPANVLVTAGTAPYGDPQPGGNRTMPVRFWREVMCLTVFLRRRTCKAPASFDVLAHHPYGTGGPRRHALNGDDAAVPDIGKLRAVLRAARRNRTALPASGTRIWVTELSWDSSPPDPDGVPEQQHAKWLVDALHVLWKQHVEAVLWFRVVDQAPSPSYGATNQSGLFLRSGTPKLAAQAYSFPVTCRRRSRGRVQLWGMAPTPSSRVTIQVRIQDEWKSSVVRRARADRVFVATFRAAVDEFRAAQGDRTSLACAAAR